MAGAIRAWGSLSMVAFIFSPNMNKDLLLCWRSSQACIKLRTISLKNQCCVKEERLEIITLSKLLLSLTNKMQRYTIFLIAVNALHVSGGFPPIIRSSKLYTQHLVCQACVLLPLSWARWHCQLTHASGSSKQAWHIPDAVCTVFSSWWWAENRLKMYSIESNKEYCITLHLVG